ncbi:Uncharacterised protein [Salmonella enterica]|uniref:Uncharacterized protein n=1 Tax=Salmonella enterica TaxID=28901 RepID=A0A7D8EU58_SALER|nr:Uncharacterised protein [Salmonella enterica]
MHWTEIITALAGLVMVVILLAMAIKRFGY